VGADGIGHDDPLHEQADAPSRKRLITADAYVGGDREERRSEPLYRDVRGRRKRSLLSASTSRSTIAPVSSESSRTSQ
jgi:hypothetical protein